jgi:heat shock protein HslJ
MKKNIGLLLIAFSIISILSTGVFAQRNLTRTAWELTQLNGRAMNDSNADLVFDSEKKGVSGNAGCNKLFGSYTEKGTSVKFSKIGTTKMFCSKPGLMKDEAEFLRALAAATRYYLNHNTLRIFAGKKLIMKFERLFPTLSLMSTGLSRRKWFLNDAGSQGTKPGHDVPFINFDREKGSAGGNTGCNVFGGSYKVDNSQKLTITDVISTMRACIEDDRMDIERKFLDGLRKADRYDIEDNTLSLFAGNTLLLTFTGYDK